MAKTVLLDEWHITFRIPSDLPNADVRAVRRALTGQAFTNAVRRAVVAVVRARPVLTSVRVAVGR